jgi:hypothetical protein
MSLDGMLVSFPVRISTHLYSQIENLSKWAGLQIEGVLAYFTHLKCQKCIGDDVGDFKYVYTKETENKHIF